MFFLKNNQNCLYAADSFSSKLAKRFEGRQRKEPEPTMVSYNDFFEGLQQNTKEVDDDDADDDIIDFHVFSLQYTALTVADDQ